MSMLGNMELFRKRFLNIKDQKFLLWAQRTNEQIVLQMVSWESLKQVKFALSEKEVNKNTEEKTSKNYF